jgi:hypothetical protein
MRATGFVSPLLLVAFRFITGGCPSSYVLAAGVSSRRTVALPGLEGKTFEEARTGPDTPRRVHPTNSFIPYRVVPRSHSRLYVVPAT